MAVNPVTSSVAMSAEAANSNAGTASGSDRPQASKKFDPESDKDLLGAAVEGFLPGMLSSTLMLNSTIFNFAKEAIDEAE